MARPALQEMLLDIGQGKVDLVVVYKVDRLTRSLMDFSRMIETFDAGKVSFVSVTQQFNTANSMGRLTLNVLLSFAQFEREVTAERIRDKIAASKKKGMWTGGLPPVGYDAVDKKLVINEEEAVMVRALFGLYLTHRNVKRVREEADRSGYVTKLRGSGDKTTGGKPFTRGHLYQLLNNPVYVGKVSHKGNTYPGQHEAIIKKAIWDKVQEQLATNTVFRKCGTNTGSPALLTGLVFDEDGARLSPSYCQKKGRRYRYYVSGHLLQGSGRTGGWRIPASLLEEVVVQEIAKFLSDGVKIVDALYGEAGSSAEIRPSVQAATELAAAITGARTNETTEIVRSILERVTVTQDQLQIALSRTELASRLGVTDLVNEEPVILDIPVAIRRRGVEQKIILRDGFRTLL